MAHKELVIAWLNDAHAMELAIAQVLERHAEEAKDHPPMHTALQRHLEQTRRHADLVKGCVERLGGETSGVKTGMASVMGAVQGMTTKLAKDDLIKNILHDFGTEHFRDCLLHLADGRRRKPRPPWRRRESAATSCGTSRPWPISSSSRSRRPPSRCSRCSTRWPAGRSRRGGR